MVRLFSRENNSGSGGLVFQSTWSAAENIPFIDFAHAPDKGMDGYYWIATDSSPEEGYTTVTGEVLHFNKGDWLIAGINDWYKLDATDAVISVNGKTGVVTIDETDILPSQAGNADKVLTTNGTSTSWTAATTIILREFD